MGECQLTKGNRGKSMFHSNIFRECMEQQVALFRNQKALYFLTNLRASKIQVR